MAEQQSGFESGLKTGRERFLAHVLEYALEIGQRSADDFIRHFPPADLMMGLKDQPNLRAQVLVLTTGLKHKIAVKKSAESAGEDLQIALNEGETDAESIVALFNPDDRIRYLEAEKLWAFCIEDEFWRVGTHQKIEHERAKLLVSFMLSRALKDNLLSHQEVVEGIGVGELATRLPRTELGKVLEQTLANAHRKSPFTERDLLGALPPAEIVKHIPLTHLWESVIVPRIAAKHGYVHKTADHVAKALDVLEGEQKAAPDSASQPQAAPAAAAEGPEGPGTGWSVPPDSDGDVEITDDDIRIT